jgi:ligand-binding sensor domain-containing protein/signal transduction histidine kinase
MKFLIFIFLFLGIKIAYSQQQDEGLRLKFEHFDEKSGLSHNVVKVIYKDSRGYMWFGTEDGLNKFDGATIKVFRHIPGDSSSISNSRITDIAEDKDAHLWLSQKGVSNFNPFSKKSINYNAKPKNSFFLSLGNDHQVYFDSKGNTWVNDITSFSLLLPDKKHFRHFHPFGEKGIFRTKMHADTIWGADEHNVYSFDVKHQKSAVYEGIFEKNFANCIKKISNNAWAVGKWLDGLYIYNPHTTQKIHVLKNLSVFDVQLIKIAGKRQLWVATENGLFIADIKNSIFDLKDSYFTHFNHQDNDNSSLSSDHLSCIYQDTVGENEVWVGTNKGINKLNPNSYQFIESFVRKDNKYIDLTDLSDIFIEKNDQGKRRYWMAYFYGSGLIQTDEHFNIIKHITFGNDSKSSEIVIKVLRGQDGKLWIASWDGVWQYDDKLNKLVKSYKHEREKESSLSSNKITAMIQDRKGRLWIGTYNFDLNLLYPATGKNTIFKSNTGQHSLSSDRTDYILEDKEGNIWIAAQSLHKYRPATNDFEVFLQDPNRVGALPGRVSFIKQDSKGTIWVATDMGVAWFDEEKHFFHVYSTAQGLGSDECYAIEEDRNGNMWVSTIGGLSCINKTNSTIKTYTVSDGLPSNELGGTIIQDTSGTMLFNISGRNTPLISFHPLSLKKISHDLPFYFTSINIMGKESFTEKPIEQTKAINLSYNENLVSVTFKALDYDNPLNIRYKYLLEGLEQNWIELGNFSSITFTNLNGGDYKLRVKATNSLGEWMDKDISLNIHVEKPFWETWWFRMLIGAIIAFLVYIVYRYRLAQALKLERLRTNISTDLHDDIGSTLSSISILSDLMMTNKDNRSFSSGEMMQEIRNSSLELMDKMDDIVWSINPKKDTLEDLMIRIQRFARQLFEARNIEYNFTMQDSIRQVKLPMEQRQHIYLIMKEGINNLIKYSGCTSGNIQITYRDSILSVEISDNGKGFDTSQPAEGNGLGSMRNRANQMNAILSFTSMTGKGTTIILQVKIR